jgi:hypothetical protein
MQNCTKSCDLKVGANINAHTYTHQLLRTGHADNSSDFR